MEEFQRSRNQKMERLLDEVGRYYNQFSSVMAVVLGGSHSRARTAS
jgi:hypothetical protein